MERYASPGKEYVHASTRLPDLAHVDWQHAPRNFKLYQGCQQIALEYEHSLFPASLERGTLTRPRMGQMLFDIYGFTRQLHMVTDVTSLSLQSLSSSFSGRQEQAVPLRLHRTVPSGGALFPCELYLLIGQGQAIPAGIYHYDAVHHALDILREGDYHQHLRACLAPQEHLSTCTLLLSCLFWKSSFKYAEFSYRVHSLDIGVVVAQCLLVAHRYGLSARVHYQFLDHAMNQLCGFDDFHESIYAAIPLGTEGVPVQEEEPASLLRPGPISFPTEPVVDASTSLHQWPLLAELHRLSCMVSADSFQPPQSISPLVPPETSVVLHLPCPDTRLKPLSSLYKRHSASGYFRAGMVTQQQLADLLALSVKGYANDLDGQRNILKYIQIYCILYNVEEVKAGVYCYHPDKHMLASIYTGDVRTELQAVQGNFDLTLSPVNICLFLVAHYERGFQVYGDRWYRIQNMETGIGIQQASLAAATLKLGCQVSLAYFVERADALLRLPEGYTCLAEIMIAPEYCAGQIYEQPLMTTP